jgi:pRiA4b ORF-3-like protein
VGYGEFPQTIADPKHERHAELLEWSGGDFDAHQFNVDEINCVLEPIPPAALIGQACDLFAMFAVCSGG